jgi:hypothetical protein
MIFLENGKLRAMVGRHQWLDGSFEHIKGDLFNIVAPVSRTHEITIKVQGNKMKMSAAYVDYTCIISRLFSNRVIFSTWKFHSI